MRSLSFSFIYGLLLAGFFVGIDGFILRLSAAPVQVYKKPYEVGIDVPSLVRIEGLIAGTAPDCPSLREALSREIGKFTVQFNRDKRIPFERRRGRFSPESYNINSVRLLTVALSKQYGRISFLGRSPLMFRLHRAMGRCYERERKIYRAISEYAMAFRYTGFDDFIRQGSAGSGNNKKQEKTSVTARLQEREKLYRQLLRGFANVDRLREESDPDIVAAGTRFRAIFKRYLRLRDEVRTAETRVDAYIARRARGENVDPQAARRAYKQLDRRKKESLREMDQIYAGPYEKYRRNKSGNEGALAYSMAILIKELEARNKKLQRILNRSSFYRGRGDSTAEDASRFNRFVGYGIFLELANRIDPENLKYIALLAEEYRASRRPFRAIAFEERYLKIAKQRKPPPAPAVMAIRYRRLGGLYTDVRNYIRAVETLESYMLTQPDKLKKSAVRLHLADLMFEKTGNYEKARGLYAVHLRNTKSEDFQKLGYRRKTFFLRKRYRASHRLASIGARMFRSKVEQAFLVLAGKEFAILEKDYKEALRGVQTMEKKIGTLKGILLRGRNDAVQTQYYALLKRDLPELQRRSDFLRTHMQAMNLPRILERRAMLAVRNRDYAAARDLYREIIIRGNGAQAGRSRINLEKVNLSIDDGIPRPLKLSPNFER